MLSVNKKGWVGSGGGGSGFITDAQNIGFGEGVYSGKSGALNEVLDFKSIAGSGGIVVSSTADEVEISASGIVGSLIPALQSFVEGTGNAPNLTYLANGALYAGVIPWGDCKVNAIQIWIEVLAASPPNYTVGIYDDAGVILGGAFTGQSPVAPGSFLIMLDSEVNLSKNEKYYIGIASLGQDDALNGDNASTSSKSWNFQIAGIRTILNEDAPIGPAGVATAVRVWFRAVYV